MQPGRVRATGAGSVDLLTEAGGVTAAVPQSVIPPVVGDWVIYDTRTALLARVLERESEFARKRAGETSRKQVLAANVDVVGIVCGLDGDLNPRRIERYLIAVAESGAEPLIILNKADLCARPDEALDTVRAAAAGAPIVVVSARSGTGLEALSLYLEPGVNHRLRGFLGRREVDAREPAARRRPHGNRGDTGFRPQRPVTPRHDGNCFRHPKAGCCWTCREYARSNPGVRRPRSAMPFLRLSRLRSCAASGIVATKANPGVGLMKGSKRAGSVTSGSSPTTSSSLNRRFSRERWTSKQR